ncbi:hypothetical protein P4256_15755 [Bacillus wiedmannii]|uniref:esterase/lipase family protein n=1 Tax=Bacillus wiedmannii TaxID=1890302 RepID=UPI002E21AFE8|nr:hypothetical protein [Bacillus wiedmannii]
MDNIQFIKQSNQENLIIFIHGFQGGIETWKYGEGAFFPELLLKDEYIARNFDIACFSYYSKLFGSCSIERVKNVVNRILYSKKSLTRKNLDIDGLSDILHTAIQIECDSYQKIIFIAHSMGGLVAKSCILKMLGDSTENKMKLFISLAVPHQGTDLATLGKSLFRGNSQIIDLTPLSTTLDKITKEWIRNGRRVPKVEYFYGKHDKVVKEHSAIGIEPEKTKVSFFDTDHIMIAKPDSTKNLIYKGVIRLLKNFLKESLVETDTGMKTNRGIIKDVDINILNTKVILQKLSFIYKLKNASSRFREDFHENFLANIDLPLGLTEKNEWIDIMSLSSKPEGIYLTDIEISMEALDDLDHVQSNLITLRTWVLEKEYEFIELASKIDTEVYKKVKQLFKTIDKGFEDILSSKNWFRYNWSNPFKNCKVGYLKRREGEADCVRLINLTQEIHFFFINVWDSHIPNFTQDIINQMHKYEGDEVK